MCLFVHASLGIVTLSAGTTLTILFTFDTIEDITFGIVDGVHDVNTERGYFTDLYSGCILSHTLHDSNSMVFWGYPLAIE